jgi:hypothetical protein
MNKDVVFQNININLVTFNKQIVSFRKCNGILMTYRLNNLLIINLLENVKLKSSSLVFHYKSNLLKIFDIKIVIMV